MKSNLNNSFLASRTWSTQQVLITFIAKNVPTICNNMPNSYSIAFATTKPLELPRAVHKDQVIDNVLQLVLGFFFTRYKLRKTYQYSKTLKFEFVNSCNLPRLRIFLALAIIMQKPQTT